jgi:hypothetical protein
MSISMNPKMSGFRKWADIHDPEKIDKASTGVNKGGGVISAADGNQGTKAQDQQPHRPWLVPGAGRL